MKFLATITFFRFLYFPIYAANIKLLGLYNAPGVVGSFISQVGLAIIVAQVLQLGFARGIYVKGHSYKPILSIHIVSTFIFLGLFALYSQLFTVEYGIFILAGFLSINQILCALNYINGRFLLATVTEYVLPALVFLFSILFFSEFSPIYLYCFSILTSLFIGALFLKNSPARSSAPVSRRFYVQNAVHAVLDAVFGRLPIVLAPFYFSGIVLDSFSIVYSIAGVSGAVSQVLNRFSGVLLHVKGLTEKNLQLVGIGLFFAVGCVSFIFWSSFLQSMNIQDPFLLLFCFVWLPQFSKIVHGGSVFAWVRVLPIRNFLILDLIVIGAFFVMSFVSYYAGVFVICLRFTFYCLFLKTSKIGPPIT